MEKKMFGNFIELQLKLHCRIEKFKTNKKVEEKKVFTAWRFLKAKI